MSRVFSRVLPTFLCIAFFLVGFGVYKGKQLRENSNIFLRSFDRHVDAMKYASTTILQDADSFDEFATEFGRCVSKLFDPDYSKEFLEVLLTVRKLPRKLRSNIRLFFKEQSVNMDKKLMPKLLQLMLVGNFNEKKSLKKFIPVVEQYYDKSKQSMKAMVDTYVSNWLLVDNLV